MTTNPEQRKKTWQNMCPSLKNWTILQKYNSKTAAQIAERKYAKKYVCRAYGGGSGPEYATWYVYIFYYQNKSHLLYKKRPLV